MRERMDNSFKSALGTLLNKIGTYVTPVGQKLSEVADKVRSLLVQRLTASGIISVVAAGVSTYNLWYTSYRAADIKIMTGPRIDIMYWGEGNLALQIPITMVNDGATLGVVYDLRAKLQRCDGSLVAELPIYRYLGVNSDLGKIRYDVYFAPEALSGNEKAAKFAQFATEDTYKHNGHELGSNDYKVVIQAQTEANEGLVDKWSFKFKLDDAGVEHIRELQNAWTYRIKSPRVIDENYPDLLGCPDG